MGRTNFVEPIPEVPDRLLAPLPFCSVLSEGETEPRTLNLFFSGRSAGCIAATAAKSMRILLLIAPKDYGGSGGKLSGGGVGHRQDPSVGRERVRPSGQLGGSAWKWNGLLPPPARKD